MGLQCSVYHQEHNIRILGFLFWFSNKFSAVSNSRLINWIVKNTLDQWSKSEEGKSKFCVREKKIFLWN